MWTIEIRPVFAMEIRNGTAEAEAAVKTVLEEGDNSLPPARWARQSRSCFKYRDISILFFILEIGGHGRGHCGAAQPQWPPGGRGGGHQLQLLQQWAGPLPLWDRDGGFCVHDTLTLFHLQISNTSASIMNTCTKSPISRNGTDFLGPGTRETSPKFSRSREEQPCV